MKAKFLQAHVERIESREDGDFDVKVAPALRQAGEKDHLTLKLPAGLPATTEQLIISMGALKAVSLWYDPESEHIVDVKFDYDYSEFG